MDDRAVEENQLKTVKLSDLRALAQVTDKGAFRPLKSAPNLQKGWKAAAGNIDELGLALGHLYPGAVADWFGFQQRRATPSGYREFTSRQTGMYRVTQMLSDAEAGAVIQACCHTRFCLKQRLWTVGGLATDSAESKSIIPCLEPCALLLEFGRIAARHKQTDEIELRLNVEEARTLSTSVTASLQKPEGEIREADFDSPINPRRIQLVVEKIEASICSQTTKS